MRWPAHGPMKRHEAMLKISSLGDSRLPSRIRDDIASEIPATDASRMITVPSSVSVLPLRVWVSDAKNTETMVRKIPEASSVVVIKRMEVRLTPLSVYA